MGKINVLGFDVANLIAAGEVVDRPASVVKELLENAVDSGADSITLEIKRGGISHIRVSDNGCGIDYEDLPLAVLRHATSKIKNASDLESICTLGFRGEALAATASVTKMKIYTRPADKEEGSYMVCEGGEILDLCEAGCAKGTTVIADELFYNVPARRKFLKRDATECAKITEIAERVALSVPDISIKYTCDGVIRFMTQGDGDLKNTIHSIFGKATSERLVKVDRSENGVRVSGYVSDTDMTFSKRGQEIFFVNGRYVRSPIMTAALERAYVSKIPADKFPMCVLNISIAPGAVDVNVHPTKLEVKFSNERIISEAVHFAVLSALSSSLSRPEMKLGEVYGNKSAETSGDIGFAPLENDKKIRQVLSGFASVEKGKKDEQLQIDNTNAEKVASTLSGISANDYSANAENESISANDKKTNVSTDAVGISSILAGYDIPTFAEPYENKKTIEKSPSSSVTSKKVPESSDADAAFRNTESPRVALVSKAEDSRIAEGEKLPDFTIIGEAYNCYVIVELADRILLIDKHAAHERIIFDELCARRKAKDKEAQLLLVPVEFSLTDDEIAVTNEYSEDIRSVGFDFSVDAASRTVSVTKIPSEIGAESASDMLRAMIAKLCDGVGTVESAEAEFFEKALYQASCKAAIKGGRYYGADHVKWICRKLLKAPGADGKVIKTCPHGRPVAFEIKKTSIERQFSRIE